MALLNSIHRLFSEEAPGAQKPPAGHNALLASLLTMAWFVEARDPYTGGHLWRVSRLSLIHI